jgi:hypothetical protein
VSALSAGFTQEGTDRLANFVYAFLFLLFHNFRINQTAWIDNSFLVCDTSHMIKLFIQRRPSLETDEHRAGKLSLKRGFERVPGYEAYIEAQVGRRVADVLVSGRRVLAVEYVVHASNYSMIMQKNTEYILDGVPVLWVLCGEEFQKVMTLRGEIPASKLEASPIRTVFFHSSWDAPVELQYNQWNRLQDVRRKSFAEILNETENVPELVLPGEGVGAL